MHESSYARMKEFRDKYVTGRFASTRVLDVGSRAVGKGETTYRPLFKDYNYVGMDVEAGRNVDVVGFENIEGKFNVLISGQVMEHIQRPWEWLSTIADLVEDGGLMCIIAPCSWKEHRFPKDCYRFLPDGMRALFEYAVIEVLEIYKKKKDCVGIGQIIT